MEIHLPYKREDGVKEFIIARAKFAKLRAIMNIDNAHCLNEGKYAVFRVYSTRKDAEAIHDSLEPLAKDGKISIKNYSPKEDANWRVNRFFEQFFDRPITNKKSLEKMLTSTVGKCSLMFLSDFKEKPKDLWIMSVFIHLLLNSLGYTGSEERSIRNFPPI